MTNGVHTKAEALERLERYRDLPARVALSYEERAHGIRVAYEAGATVSEIARALELGRKTVYEALERVRYE